MFRDFDEQAFAAASIGQVHRATTLDGDEVAVKIQYPGVAEAVETDLRNATLLLPLVKRLAPGLDAKALASEMRERISEELDYELEAQNQRRIGRLMRGHPFVLVPRVHTDLSTRRVLVSEYVDGEGFEAVRRADEAQRDRYGEIVFRFHFGLLYRDRIGLGDPHPGNYLLTPDGRVCFLDFGLVRYVTARSRRGRAGDRPCCPRPGTGKLSRRPCSPAAISHAGGADAVDADFALGMMRMATKWYAVPGHRRFEPDDDRRRRDREPSRQRGTGGNEDAGQPVHLARRSNPDPADARRCRDRAAPAPSGRGLGRHRRGVPPRSSAGHAARASRGRLLRALRLSGHPATLAERRPRRGRFPSRRSPVRSLRHGYGGRHVPAFAQTRRASLGGSTATGGPLNLSTVCAPIAASESCGGRGVPGSTAGVLAVDSS